MKKIDFFDSSYSEMEQLPRKFIVNFATVKFQSKEKTRVSINDMQVGDLIDNNSKENDSYRFHDIFHYTFAAVLGWSPCTRSMLKRKRKSNSFADEIEDGARATITEEAISLLLFNKAKQKDFFQNGKKINSGLLTQIKEMTNSFEVNIRSKKEWETAIILAYSLFINLSKNNGGLVHFDMYNKSAVYEVSN